ncbi:MAG TPA: hypothetical protein EYG85_03745 [Crocinitomix sp.]|nr:hypothetical protein [Crocinitomix sp.]
MKLFSFIGIFLLTTVSFSYKIDDYQLYKTKHKDERAVVLNYNQTVNASINKKTGELELYRTVDSNSKFNL